MTPGTQGTERASLGAEVLRLLGLMSGSSADGIDAALLECGSEGRPVFLGHRHHPYPASLQGRIVAANALQDLETAAQLERELGLEHARFAAACLADWGRVDAIAVHGQTIRHRPRHEPAFTIQLSAAPDLAVATGLTVVHDFRRADVAAGGQGAPLVPPFQQALFAAERTRLFLNIGGIANLTVLPGREDGGPLAAWDCGPGNALLDAAVVLLSGGQQRYDADGAWARQGEVRTEVLANWLSWDYFRRPPPKSTGREDFSAELVRSLWRDWPFRAADFLATLTALTVESIATSLESWAAPAEGLWVFGGGADNVFLMALLANRLPHLPLYKGTPEGGLPHLAVEAAAFAWLGDRCLRGVALDLHEVTGQRQPIVLGTILPGSNWAELLAKLRCMGENP